MRESNKLVLEYTVVYDTVLVARIVAHPEDFNRGGGRLCDGVRSDFYPDFSDRCVNIGGENREMDGKPMLRSFTSPAALEAYQEKLTTWVRNFNDTLTPPKPDKECPCRTGIIE